MKIKYEFRILQPEQADPIVCWNEGRDADFLMQWAGKALTYPVTREQILETQKTSSAVFAILFEGQMIGTIALTSVDEQTGRGHIGHFLLDPAMTGKGHGSAIVQEFVDYCFGILRLRELTLRVFDYNKSALHCYEKNGFVERERMKTGQGDNNLLMGLYKQKIKSSDQTPIVICDETQGDWYATELMTQHAFWNLHWPGCNEHLLVSNLRKSRDYIPKLSKIAKLGDEIAGAIMYSTAYVVDRTGSRHEVLTFGPLCVEPRYQSLGIGGKLLRATMQQAREEGYPAIIIFGESGYYPRFGFTTCDHFGITTPEGSNFDAFMGMELRPGSLTGITGKFYEADVFGDRPAEEIEAYDSKFPRLVKCKLPGQW